MNTYIACSMLKRAFLPILHDISADKPLNNCTSDLTKVISHI